MSLDYQQIEQLEEEITQLKRQLILKENDFKKNEAVLKQQNELQQMQIEDFKRREQNFKKMNETIMNTLNDLSSNQKPNSSLLKEIQTTIQQHSIDLQTQKHKNGDAYLELEQENRNLKEQIQELEEKLRLTSLNQDEQVDNYMNQIINLEKQIDLLKLEKEQYSQKIDQENGQKTKELEKDINEMKIRFQKEFQIEQDKHRQEKATLEQRLEKNQQMIKKYQQIMEKNPQIDELQQSVLILQNQLQEKEQQHEIEMTKVMRDKEDLCQMNQTLEHQIRNINEENPMNLSYVTNSTQMNQTTTQNTQNTQQSDHSIHKQSIAELKRSIKELERQKLGQIRVSQKQNPLTSSLYDNNNTNESVIQKNPNYNNTNESIYENQKLGKIRMSKNSKAQQIVSEIDRSLQQNISLLPEDLEDHDNISSIPLNKDSSQILFEDDHSCYLNENTKENMLPQHSQHTMSKKRKNVDQMPLALSEFEKRKFSNNNLSQQQQAITTRNLSSNNFNNNSNSNIQTLQKPLRSSHSSNNFLKSSGQNTFKSNQNLSQSRQFSQQQPLQSNQNIQNFNNYSNLSQSINQSINNFQKNKKFSDNLDASQNNQSINLQHNASNYSLSTSQSNKQFFKIFEQLNSEKQHIEEKLYQLENRLKYSEDHNDELNEDRERLKGELNNVMKELNKTKMNHNVQDEEQEACTSALKTEIKFLINKLLKAKGKLSENKSPQNGHTTMYNDQQLDMSVTQSANFSRFNQNNTSIHQQQQQFRQQPINQSVNNNSMFREYSNFSIKSRDFLQNNF